VHLAFAASLCLIASWVVGKDRYRFFADEAGPIFVARSAIMDFLNHIAAGVGVTVGKMMNHLIGGPTRSASLEAFAEVGVKTWPPIPRKLQEITPPPKS
jgi:hypothetical protein